MYKTPLGSGKHDITCPRVHEHTDGVNNGTAYFEPDESFPTVVFVAIIRMATTPHP